MEKIPNDCERVNRKIEACGELKSDMKKNDSLDSGIAGIKDPQFANNNNNELTMGSNENVSGDERCVRDTTSDTTYMKGRFLGKGGFARVHELLDTSSNVVYAGKIIPKTRITKRQYLQKIAREILIHRELVHQNVVRLHRFFEDSQNAYIILENCPMKSLVHVLRQRQTVTEPEVRYYLMQLVNGVKYIHSQNIVHRDLKPGNMLLTEDMIVKVGDFGLATLANAEAPVTICGTPNYIAPEVLTKESYSFEADVWAIGCIMFTLLAGQPPFETSSLRETYSRILRNNYCLPLGASHMAKTLMYELLSPDPKDRPSLAQIEDSMFLKQGFRPRVLPTSSCYKEPNFNLSTFRDDGPNLRPPEPREPFGEPNATSLKVRKPLGPIARPRMPLRDMLSPNAQAPAAGPSSAGPFPLGPSPAGPPPLGASLFVPSPMIGLPPFVVPPIVPIRMMSLRQKLGRVLCTDAMSFCRFSKRETNAGHLYKTLCNTLCVIPNGLAAGPSNPCAVDWSPLCVSKWIDYSNKYGFGFQLTDKSVGVLFNDNTRIAFTPDRSRVEFHDVNGVVSAHPQHSVPSVLGDRHTQLRYFSKYMDENLTEGADVRCSTCHYKTTVPHMKRWVRTNTAMIMELSTGTLQINFFEDHTKVIISQSKQGYMVTYVNEERQSNTYSLQSIAMFGCDPGIYERLRFATAVVYEFAVLEGGN